MYFHARDEVMHMFMEYSMYSMNNIGMCLIYSQIKFLMPFTYDNCFTYFTPSSFVVAITPPFPTVLHKIRKYS